MDVQQRHNVIYKDTLDEHYEIRLREQAQSAICISNERGHSNLVSTAMKLAMQSAARKLSTKTSVSKKLVISTATATILLTTDR